MRTRHLFIALLLLLTPPLATAETRIHVDTVSNVVTVWQGERIVDYLAGASFGRDGPAPYKQAGDGRTPLGEYRVAWINEQSDFHRFYGLDYPTSEQADQALAEGLIDSATHARIQAAHRAHRIPPQNTSLGGQIGIHGLGEGDLRVHEDYHWTLGCVALTNEQIDRLDRWVRIGTQVIIE